MRSRQQSLECCDVLLQNVTLKLEYTRKSSLQLVCCSLLMLHTSVCSPPNNLVSYAHTPHINAGLCSGACTPSYMPEQTQMQRTGKESHPCTWQQV